MCEFCDENILLDIRKPYVHPEKKLIYGIYALRKALGMDLGSKKSEVSPYRSVREMIQESIDRVNELLVELYRQILFTWLNFEKAKKDSPFVLNNRIFINPKTGKPLTDKEWKQIKADILRAFNYIYKNEEERIAQHAIALGKILKGMPLTTALEMGYKKLDDQIKQTMKLLKNDRWKNTVNFARQHAGEHIVELSQRQYTRIHDALQNSIRNREDARTLAQRLFEVFGDMNRDWRRIAETEIGTATNTGILLSELDDKKDDEEYVFVRGISSPQACSFCKTKVDGKVFVLLEEPPNNGTDKITIKGTQYTAIWPGKTNVGRSRRDWWVSAGTQHPHCLCTWVKYVPGFEKWDTKIRSALKDALKRSERKEKPVEDFEVLLKPTPDFMKKQ